MLTHIGQLQIVEHVPGEFDERTTWGRGLQKTHRISLGLILLLTVVALHGCSRGGERFDLASVKGQVELDGKPLANALVTFCPVDGRRESYGITDQSGRFELRYNSRLKGAEIGHHEVRICSPSVDPKSTQSPSENTSGIPAEYSGKNFLPQEVVRGKNQILLELRSSPTGAKK